MLRAKRFVEELLLKAGIRINGSDPWDIRVYNDAFYGRVLRRQSLGLGEAYMDGWWDCPRIDEFICRLLGARLDEKLRGTLSVLPLYLSSLFLNRQSRSRSSAVAERHYNLGNDLFGSFLDPLRQYSCAYFDRTDDLAEAQLKKIELVCRKLGLAKEEKLLDIGCGWGGLAKYAAERYGCAVTAVNISTEQIRHARDWCKGLPVRILECDYRDIEGCFDKVVSVGMFEHVGSRNYRTFMKVVHRCLKAGGTFLLHTIGGNVSQINCDPWINRYIFPGGMLPSIAQISRAVEGLFVVEDWHNLGPHYDRTLMAWNANFQRAWEGLKGAYDGRFKRMWEYYLLSFAGAFRARSIQVWQIVLTPSGTPQPACRL
jgi:cyclopropane-fatty-acyl-phospholipid synthase